MNALPSKIFEYATLGKPIWAGVSGFSAEFLLKNVSNVAIFNPCQIQQAIDVFEELKLRTQPRHAFVKKFSRELIMREMTKDILHSDNLTEK